MPRWVWPAILIIVSFAILAIAVVVRDRYSRSPELGIHLIPDMDRQLKYKAQAENPIFADGRAMRLPVPGTIARDELQDDEHLYRGKVNGEWADTFPVEINDAIMKRGRERYDIYCAVCHGYLGEGNGLIALRAKELQEGTWVPPTTFHSDNLREKPVGSLFNTITNGIRNMPAYGAQIPLEDRWGIVLYMRALQKGQNASINDVPEDVRQSLR